MAEFIDWMPEQGSEYAADVDWTNAFITYTALFFIVAITLTMLYFAFHYRRSKRGDKTEYITHNTALEVVWTVIPIIIILFVFYFGTTSFFEYRSLPLNPIEIAVEGYQWGWDFTYPSGKKSSTELVVPIGRPVRLIMRSRDVNHSLFIPAMRVKEDVIAGTYHYLSFTPNKLGNFPIFCAEYCGLSHSYMLSTLRVVQPEDYDQFITGRPPEEMAPAELGLQVFQVKGCGACHSVDGSARVGPTLKGAFNRNRQFTDGTQAAGDENYARESILEPNKKIVAGFPPAMPSFAGQLSDTDLNNLIAYLKSLQ